MGLYEELETINRAIKRKALDQADFRALLPNLLKKYKPSKAELKKKKHYPINKKYER